MMENHKLDAAPLDAIMARYVDPSLQATHKLRNASYVIKDASGKTLYASSSGLRTFTTSDPFTEDSIVCVHSMTKLVTAVAVLQAVQMGLVTLDSDVADTHPYLCEMQVLRGFDSDGKPFLSKNSCGSITLRKMILHTAGFGLDVFDELLVRWLSTTGAQSAQTRTYEGQKAPLLFDTDDRWHYGHGCAWAGIALEKLTGMRLGDFLRKNIFEPLRMGSTTFRPADLHERLTDMALRKPLGTLVQTKSALDPLEEDFEVDLGGGGLFTTAKDFSTFVSAVLRNDPLLNIEQTLWQELFKQQLDDRLRDTFKEEIISKKVRGLLGREYISKAQDPELVCDIGFTLGGSMNFEDLKSGRKKGSIRWLGSANTFWWIDKEAGICGVFMTQIYPLGDKVVDNLLEELEMEVYRQL